MVLTGKGGVIGETPVTGLFRHHISQVERPGIEPGSPLQEVND